jgi:hypothetical protein
MAAAAERRTETAPGRAGRLLAALTLAVVVGTLGFDIGTAGQLAERPLIGAAAHPAIAYATGPTTDVVADLNRRLADGASPLPFEEHFGYLKATLEALRVPVESQMLVMSKTWIQGLHTGPDNPRAIYFNDTVTVGFIHGAPLLELAVQDALQGVVFYTIDQKPSARPIFDRRQGCLNCHQAYSTLHVPGMLARSVFVGPDGLPMGQFGSYDPDDRTPFRQRWGGWYVTGTHGDMRHMGNAIVANPSNRDEMISDRTLNRTSLAGAFDTNAYPAATSDISALMVFLHQAHAMNLLTRLGWQARIAAASGQLAVSESPLRDAIAELVDYFLFVDEQPLTAPVKGNAGFAEWFARQGPADAQGRSLRQLDLEHRLLRYPCSYMIYAPAFAALPAELKAAIYARMWVILSGGEADAKHARLTAVDRRAVLDVLRGTVRDLPDLFRSSDLAR